MLEQLSHQKDLLVSKIQQVQQERNFQTVKLKLANKKFYTMILESILKIQRWFRHWRIRKFLKTILSKDLELRKRELILAIADMQKQVRHQEAEMIEKYKQIRLEGERDKAQEEYFRNIRNAEQLDRATRVANFETSFLKIVGRIMQLQQEDVFRTLNQWSTDPDC